MARPITRFYERALYNEKTRPITIDQFLYRCKNYNHLPSHEYKEKIETLLDVPRKPHTAKVDDNGRECVTCKEYKSRGYFYIFKSWAECICKECKYIYYREWREKAKLKKDIKKV